MEKPATPLPWQYRDDYTTEGFVTIIGNIDGEYVDGKPECTYDVVCRCEDEFGERVPNVGDNVRYIVTACNAYPRLTAINAELVACLESLAPELRIMAEWTHSPLSDEYAEKYRKCMDTLARAKESSHDAD